MQRRDPRLWLGQFCTELGKEPGDAVLSSPSPLGLGPRADTLLSGCSSLLHTAKSLS